MEPTTLTGYTGFDIGSWPFSPKFQDFATFLGIPAERDAKGTNWRFDEKTSKKIEQIYVWGMMKAKSGEHEDIKKAVFDLQRKVGVNWVGKTLVERLWQHTMFDANFKREIVNFVKSKQKEAVKEQEKKDEDMERKVDNRPQKGIPVPIKKLGRIETIVRSMKNEMEIGESKQEPTKPIPIEI